MSKLFLVCLALAIVASASAKSLKTVPVCKDRSHYFLANDESCKSYYVCYEGTATLQKCPGELLWDNGLQVCNYPTAVKCSDNPEPEPEVPTEAPVKPEPETEAPAPGTEAPEPVTTKKPVPVTTPQPPPSGGDFNCPADKFTYVAHPTNCNQFYLCKAGIFQNVYNCGEGLSFTTKPLQACVRPEKSDCRAK